MRLAREIAEMVMPENDGEYRITIVQRAYDEERAKLAAAIAAKLEPLRDVLYVGLGAAMLVTPRSEPVIDKIKAGIESLSEEE